MENKPAWLQEAIRARVDKGMPTWLKEGLELRAGGDDQRASIPATPTVNQSNFPTVDAIAAGIIKREGGFVNDPDDPGGATNFGVTIGTMRALGVDINNDGTVNTEDVKLMTAERAQDIFVTEFFKRPKIDQLPEELQATVFDMQVNSGGNAIKILQRTLNAHLDTPLAVDGVVGPATLKAAASVYRDLGSELVNEYGVGRRDYYYGLADNRPSSRKFARTRAGGKGGWIKRAEEFLPQEQHLTEEQHTSRTSLWG
jgi:lysozyme family protein